VGVREGKAENGMRRESGKKQGTGKEKGLSVCAKSGRDIRLNYY